MAVQYSLKEAAKIIGVSYSRAWHAYAYGRLAWPRRVGKMFILDESEVKNLRTHLDNLTKGEHHVPVTDGRTVQGF